jgi:hypothetical protein
MDDGGLWKTDVKTQRTRRVADVDFGSPADQEDLVTIGGTMFMSTSSGVYESDGTAAGTRLIDPLDEYGFHPEQLTRVGDALFLVASDGDRGRELWKVVPASRS